MRGFAPKKANTIIITVIVILVIVFSILGFLSKGKKQPPLPTVRIETAENGALLEYITALGQIEPKKMVEIIAKISARITDIPFKEGETVKAGDVILRLDSKNLESQLRLNQASKDAQAAQLEVEKVRIKSQQASLEGISANLKQSKIDLQRQVNLLKTKDVSISVVDKARCEVAGYQSLYDSANYSLVAAELNLNVMRHNLDASEARVDQARELLSYTTISTPIDGVVIRTNADIGEMVMTGTIIMEVADLSQMLLVAEVDEADVGKVKLGQPAQIRVQAFMDDKFTGSVKTIALKNDRSSNGTKYFKTEILVDSSKIQLHSGLTADVDIKTNEYSDIIKIPSQSVLARKVDDLPKEIRDGCHWIDDKKTITTVVFRLIDNKAISTPVTIGPSYLTHTTIKEGLSIGDKIIIGPYKELEKLSHNKALKAEQDIQPKINSGADNDE